MANLAYQFQVFLEEPNMRLFLSEESRRFRQAIIMLGSVLPFPCNGGKVVDCVCRIALHEGLFTSPAPGLLVP